MTKKKLEKEVKNLKIQNKLLLDMIADLEDFIKRTGAACPECGRSGLDCHNYQG